MILGYNLDYFTSISFESQIYRIPGKNARLSNLYYFCIFFKMSLAI